MRKTLSMAVVVVSLSLTAACVGHTTPTIVAPSIVHRTVLQHHTTIINHHTTVVRHTVVSRSKISLVKH